MRIDGGKVFVDGVFKDANLLCEGETISAVCYRKGIAAFPHHEAFDARGCYVIPGLIDLHFHGCMGHDFCEGTHDAFHALCAYEASRGVTSVCPATMTYPEEKLSHIMTQAVSFAPAPHESALVGINMEGPFISHGKIGAQNPAYVQPCDANMIRRLQALSGGLIKLVDIAPEERGALEFIREMHDEVCISLAHTCADYQQACDAFGAGACHVTHLCNAMPPLLHRAPGPIAAAFDASHSTVELICDGIHIHPAMVRCMFGLFGDDRIVLVSDTMEATGLEDGSYELGGQEVFVHGKEARLAAGALAGSVSDLMTCLRCAVQDMNIAFESALKAATENPARVLGLDNERGFIKPGYFADFVVLDKNLEIKQVFIRGKELL